MNKEWFTLNSESLHHAIPGILAVAAFYNACVWIVQPANRTHLYFSLLPGLSALTALASDHPAMARLVRASEAGLLPALSLLFLHALFSGLRGAGAPWLLGYRASTRHGARDFTAVVTAFGLLNAFMAFLGIVPTAVFAITVGLHVLAGAMLVLALLRRQKRAYATCAGLSAFVGANLLRVRMPERFDSYFAAAGMLFFVLAMIVVLAIDRYHVHRDLSRSRDVLRRANRKLRELDHRKNRFIASTAREMNAPLEAMLERCVGMLDRPGHALGPGLTQDLMNIIEMAGRMSRRMQRLELHFGRLAREGPNMQNVRLDRLAEMEVALLRRLHPDLELDLKCGTDTEIRGDPSLLRLLIEEVADNCLKHATGRKSRLWIEIAQHEDGGVQLLLRDPGHVIMPGEVENLTREFSPGSEGQASGIGLSLVRRIAELHGAAFRMHDLNAPEPYANALAIAFRPAIGADQVHELQLRVAHVEFLMAIEQEAQALQEAAQLREEEPGIETRFSESVRLLLTRSTANG